MKKLIGPVEGVVAQAASSAAAMAVKARARVLRIGVLLVRAGVRAKGGSTRGDALSILGEFPGSGTGFARSACLDPRHHLPQRVPAVPGAADHRQADPAAVRWRRGRV